MRLLAGDDNTRSNDWLSIISTIGGSVADIVTAAKAPAGTVATPNVYPANSIAAASSGGSMMLVFGVLLIVLFFVLLKK